MVRKLLFPALFALCMWGCSTRTIYVPDGKAVRLRESIEAAVWVLDRNGNQVPGWMVLPEGWYCLPIDDTGGE